MPELPAGLRERGQGWGRVWTQPRGAPSSPSPHQGWCRGSRAVPAGSTGTARPPLCALQPGSPRCVRDGLPGHHRASKRLRHLVLPSLQVGSSCRDTAGAGQGAQSHLSAGASATALAMLVGVHGVPWASRPWGSALALLGVPALPGTSLPASHCPPLLVRGGFRSRCTHSSCALPGSGCEAPAGLSSMPAAPGASRVPGLSRWHRLLLRAMSWGGLEPPKPCSALGMRRARSRRARHSSMAGFGWGVLRVSRWADGEWGAQRGTHGAPSAPTRHGGHPTAPGGLGTAGERLRSREHG